MNFDSMTRFLDTLPGLGNPGSDCAVMKEHRTLYRHQVGWSDVEAGIPMNGAEQYFLYSVSKLFTCTAALQLYERGAFLLTDPLYEYIPEFRDMYVKTVLPNNGIRLEKAKEPIRIQHLFTMTAGFDYAIDTPAIRKVQAETGGRAPTLEVAKALASQPLQFEPGSHHLYSLAHDVLGALVEVITGKTFGRYLEENIFTPLELTRSRFYHKGDALSGMMAQYLRDPVTRKISRIPLENDYSFGSEYESGGAGLISCVEDCVRFGDALANGGVAWNGERLLSSHTIRLMHTNHLTGQPLEDFKVHGLPGYGYGLGVRTLMDPAAGGCNAPVGEFGWCGAASAYLLIDPKNHVSMYYATHVKCGLEHYIQPRLRNILYGCL